MSKGWSNNVRRYAREHYIEPARSAGAEFVKIHSGTISEQMIKSDLLLPNRFPLVCNALGSERLYMESGAELVEKQGPPSGQSSAVTFVYRIAKKTSSKPNATTGKPNSFQSLRGILKKTYQKLGGAEAFHSSERESWER